MYCPDPPDIYGGAIEETLKEFNPVNHPHIRTEAFLKSKWATLRSKFSIAYRRWSASGQGDPDTFPDFCSGDTTLAYAFCVFYKLPSLEFVIRQVPESAMGEAGIGGDETTPTKLKRSQRPLSQRKPKDAELDRHESLNAMSTAVRSLAESFRSKETPSGSLILSQKVEESQAARTHAESLDALMELEKKLKAELSSVARLNDEAEERSLNKRLFWVREEIESDGENQGLERSFKH